MGLKIEKLCDDRPYWLFADNLTEPKVMVYKNSYETIAKDGQTKIPVLEFTDGEHEKVLVSLWKTDVSHVVKKYGSDTDKWINQHLEISKSKGRFILKAIEETIY